MGNSTYKAITSSFILWRGIALPGHEACRLYTQKSRRHLDGMAVFSHEKQPCQLSYHIVCDADWLTQSATVQGWIGEKNINIHLEVRPGQKWYLNEVAVPEVSGCFDLDLNFSPSTNTIAIRRLKLAPGEHKDVTAAWLRFPSLSLEPLAQSYQRLDENRYRYESGKGSFAADLVTDVSGLVTEYPGIWTAEAISRL